MKAITDKKLLAECIIETMRSSGKGGQHVNTTDSAVKLTHQPTGLTVKIQSHRSQHRNKAEALVILREKIANYYKVDKPRIKTKTTKGAKERTLKCKKKNALIKQNRRKPSLSDF